MKGQPVIGAAFFVSAHMIDTINTRTLGSLDTRIHLCAYPYQNVSIWCGFLNRFARKPMNKMTFTFVKRLYCKRFQNLHHFKALPPETPETRALRPTIIFNDGR